MCAFGREKAWLGAALAAFGVGCGEGDGGREIRDKGDKEIKTDNAPVGQDEVIDEELVVRKRKTLLGKWRDRPHSDSIGKRGGQNEERGKGRVGQLRVTDLETY